MDNPRRPSGCDFDRSLHIDLAANASALIVETLVFGRAAMGEKLSNARLKDRIEITRAGKPLFVDGVRLNGDNSAQLNRSFGAAGSGAVAILVLVGPRAAAALDPVRDALPKAAGASLVGEDLMVVRILAADSYLLRHSLMPILNRLTENRLPRPWMI